MVAVLQGKEKPLDLQQLATGLCQSLPNYARPIFVRLLSELDLTGKYFYSTFFSRISIHKESSSFYQFFSISVSVNILHNILID